MDLCGLLIRHFGADSVDCDPATLDRYSGDALGGYRALEAAPLLESRAQAVVHAREVNQVVELLKLAHREGFPVVPRGAGTGVMGAAVPVRGGVVLDLTGLNRILDLDAEALTVTVEPGVILEDLHRFLKGHGLILGHDPWSRPIATVGGALSTDGVGYLAAAYGSMGQQALGLEVVLATGELVRFPAVPKAAGPDWKRLFIGSEGLLGVIVQATLRVFPEPEVRDLRALRFPGFDQGVQALLALRRQGLRPSLVDFYEEVGFRGHRQVRLYLAFEGPREVVQASWHRAEALLRAHGAAPESPEVAREFWESRHDLALQYARHALRAPSSLRRKILSRLPMDYPHVALPASQVLAYRQEAQRIVENLGFRVREWSVWGVPEFFSLMVFDLDPRWKTSRRRMQQLVHQLLRLAQDSGGSMEYCHGIGIKGLRLVATEWGPEGLEALRRIKRALDPRNLLNPGKWLE